MSQRPALMRRPEYAGRAGRAGLVATGISVALTFVVAVAGTSIMEPPYPGRPGQPPGAVNAQLSPYLAIALAGGALAVGTMGLALPILAPAGVAAALTHWGSADQQATYLQEFAGENVPRGRGVRRRRRLEARCRVAQIGRADVSSDAFEGVGQLVHLCDVVRLQAVTECVHDRHGIFEKHADQLNRERIVAAANRLDARAIDGNAHAATVSSAKR